MLIGLDDTDSASGGCTTALVATVLAALPGTVLRGMPRLVRLNPNVPHKTRGNGAIVLDVGTPKGPRVQVGAWDGGAVYAYPDGDDLVPDEAMLERVWETVLDAAEEDSDPGVVMSTDAPPNLVYWQGVRSDVGLEEARMILDASRAMHRGGRGVIGATAAMAWEGPASSHELLAYRMPQHVGSDRMVQATPLSLLDSNGATFHSYDPEEGVLACVPHTPCPVLAGLRGLDGERLVKEALPALRSATLEPLRGWFVFSSNQASGDHVSAVNATSQTETWATIAAPLTVHALPERQRGGHAGVVALDALGHPVDVVAFEPTKGLRDVLCALRPGDTIVAVGAFKDDRIHLEALRVVSMAPAETKVANPTCTRCGRPMKSRGREAGYRCPDGHGSAPEDAAVRLLEERTLRPGWYEVPVMARRHLHRPLWMDAIVQ